MENKYPSTSYEEELMIIDQKFLIIKYIYIDPKYITEIKEIYIETSKELQIYFRDKKAKICQLDASWN